MFKDTGATDARLDIVIFCPETGSLGSKRTHDLAAKDVDEVVLFSTVADGRQLVKAEI